MVTIGQDQMTFEAGPWQSFGLEMLGKLVHRVDVESNKDREKTSPSKTSLGEKVSSGRKVAASEKRG